MDTPQKTILLLFLNSTLYQILNAKTVVSDTKGFHIHDANNVMIINVNANKHVDARNSTGVNLEDYLKINHDGTVEFRPPKKKCSQRNARRQNQSSQCTPLVQTKAIMAESNELLQAQGHSVASLRHGTQLQINKPIMAESGESAENHNIQQPHIQGNVISSMRHGSPIAKHKPIMAESDEVHVNNNMQQSYVQGHGSPIAKPKLIMAASDELPVNDHIQQPYVQGPPISSMRHGSPIAKPKLIMAASDELPVNNNVQQPYVQGPPISSIRHGSPIVKQKPMMAASDELPESNNLQQSSYVKRHVHHSHSSGHVHRHHTSHHG